MSRRRMFGIALCLAAASGGAAWAQKKGHDTNAVAEKLVNQAIAVKEGDLVVVSGSRADADLLEELYIQIRKRGGQPLVTLFPGSDLDKRIWAEVPPKYDGLSPRASMHVAMLADLTINVEGDGPAPAVLADLPQERITSATKANRVVEQISQSRGVPAINLGNGLYPGPNNAARLGVSQAELSEAFWSAVNTDYAKLSQTGAGLVAALSAGKELEITHPNGTSLKMRVEGRKALVSDGAVSDAERAQGGAAAIVWLPAGEVYLTPVPGTAEGTVVDEWRAASGTSKEVQGLTLTFKEGRVTSMKAKTPMDALKREYDAAPEGKDALGVIDLGINPSLKAGKGKLESYVHSGMVTVFVGSNTWAGGDNNAAYGLPMHIPGATVKLDGKVLVENGVLK